ncbi:MAG: metal-dependent hydrolase, partial [bacterium]
LGHQVGFVIEWGGHRIYHAGDTGLFSDMKLIDEFLNPDVGLIPIGDRFTMGPRSAARAVEFLEVDQVIPMHYNTFELVEQDPQDFVNFVGNKAEVVVLDPGESHQLLS